MSKNRIDEIEQQIDTDFANNPLIKKGYSQAVWTLLSVLEDFFFEIYQKDGEDYEKQSIAADNLMNNITHPIQICYLQAERTKKICYNLDDEDYQNALDWIHLANHYNNYCTIFPMWRRSQIEVQIHENKLVTNNWSTAPLQYEAYNRIIRKDGKKNASISNPNEIIELLRPPIVSLLGENQFRVNFNPKLVKKLIEFCKPHFDIRHILPGDWETSSFSLRDFKVVYITIQSMLYAWNVTRSILALNGLYQSGCSSSVWIERKEALLMRLKRYTKIDRKTLFKILKYLTFGEMGIKYPDVAIQPLIDLGNGYYALSPFLWLQSNSERNLCVLLNQIPGEKKKYSELTQHKEDLLRNEIKNYLEPLGYEIVHGNLQDTDLDVGIVDHSSRACLAIELKWFIEPAEVREITNRSLELKKGVSQIKKVNTAFQAGNTKLLENILAIEKDYAFLGVVGSRNWIGHFDVQDEEVPIIKVWHLLELIKKSGSLKKIISFLKNREYLPVQDENYSIKPITVECGNWICDWYGIGILDGYTKYSYS